MPSSRSSKRRAAEPESSSDEDMKIEAIADSAGTSQSSRSKGKRAHAHLADAASASGSGSASSSQKAVQDIILLDSEPDEPPAESAAPSESIPLSSYTCPICFYPPASAVLTPCGHILCGECLFTAVSSAQARQPGPAGAARCPVCRAILEGWDGRGGGVIGLEVRQVITL
ncbi:hypothetical protein BOTBODRAFT_170411 [Botryobasidium botryosum FD-172 SS1]|uniref:RING-type domain-containing protein n=1 Tax=Botryobasidium botryosum (strain FD-172 SS1) TaxID=930990 RepID=A0A067N696_BOTB1|nr:hypothetical protein BOTBODRAFT_170411 [Botryobasidium botryosum FD-172 SS1]